MKETKSLKLKYFGHRAILEVSKLASTLSDGSQFHMRGSVAASALFACGSCVQYIYSTCVLILHALTTANVVLTAASLQIKCSCSVTIPKWDIEARIPLERQCAPSCQRFYTEPHQKATSKTLGFFFFDPLMMWSSVYKTLVSQKVGQSGHYCFCQRCLCISL